ncbi:hypothetical protein [Nonomuraea sp. NPDC049028]|uniref:hypothetical protein n=1 Tax=Nonomuraea sp. NPDC049028 TaxID=3364348 RepID=UPI00371F1CBD
MSGRVGRPQGRPRGSTEQANALAEFLLTLTSGMTVRELAGRYHVGKTLWGEYRSGQKIIPLELLRRLVRDRTPDERTRQVRMETASRLHQAALEGPLQTPAPAASPSIAGPSTATAPAKAPEHPPGLEPAPTAGPVLAGKAASAGSQRARPLTRNMLNSGGAGIVILAVLMLLLGLGPASSMDTAASAPGTREVGDTPTAAPLTGTSVFAIGPDGRGVFQWDGDDTTRWTRIGAAAKQLWSGPAGLFATGMDNLLYAYGGRPGYWFPIGEPGGDLAVSGTHVYRLAADRQAVHIWDGHGTSWTQIGGPAARLYGGEPGLFATDPNDGRIFTYLGRPGQWDFVGTAGASFALTDRHLYGLTPERTTVNRWLAGARPPWVYAAGPADDLYGGAAGLFSTDPSRERLRVLTEPGTDAKNQNWQDIGPAGAEVRVGRREVYVLTQDRSQILRWSRDTGTWRRIGGPARTLTVWAAQDDPGAGRAGNP